jgi:hypothetical protein
MSISHNGVRGGTPSHEPLCRSCIHANYIRGNSATKVILLCDVFAMWSDPKELPFEAYECRKYDNKNVDLGDLQKIAWTLEKDQKNRVVGFVPPHAEGEEE